MLDSIRLYWWSPATQFVLLSLTAWLAYFDVCKGSWVSDDIQGMALYDGKLQRPIHLGNLWKKLRYEFGKRPNPNKRWKEEKQPAYYSDFTIHHRFNIWFFCGVTCLLYSFLCRILDPQVAFLAALLFAVHPLGTQTVGWISGINYVTGAFFMLLGLNAIYLFQDAGWLTNPLGTIGAVSLYALCHWIALEAMFSMLGAFLILVYLHLWPFAIVAGGMAIYIGIHAFKEAIVLRKNTFIEQKMEASIRITRRRFIVVFKTIWYYTKLILFPKRMGLYHDYCYHYELPYVETEDKRTIYGILLVFLYGVALLYAPAQVQFGLIWSIAFIFLFLNWIIANQAFTERYAWMSAVGPAIIVAQYAPPWIYWIVFGIALMRTWAHLPTYYNETQFYLSNMFNFPGSEIAMGNLGVTYLGRGLIGYSYDTFLLGMKLNPDYDVNWYNLHSMLKTRGPMNPNYIPSLSEVIPKEVLQTATSVPIKQHLILAHYCLHRALTCRTCHFPAHWQKELVEIEDILKQEPNPIFISARTDQSITVATSTVTVSTPTIIAPS